LNFIEQLSKLEKVKLSLGKKAALLFQFSKSVSAISMADMNAKLDILNDLSPANQLLRAFTIINEKDGVIIFNLSGVDIEKSKTGFNSYDEASDNNMITEWELSIILKNEDYLKRTIFHNGKVEFPQIKAGIELTW
jgi:hypothetical protein